LLPLNSLAIMQRQAAPRTAGSNWMSSPLTQSPSKHFKASCGTPVDARPMTVPEFLAAKTRGVRLTMLTAYDYTMARLLDAAGVDGLLVGDSLGMVVQGHEHSLGVTLDEMIYHTKMVARGVKQSLLVADMPFMTFQVSPQQALENAGQLVKDRVEQIAK